MTSLRIQFGNRLRFLRKKANLTQEALAAKTEISVDFISLIERGVNAPSFENIEKLAKALNVSVTTFFQFENNARNGQNPSPSVDG